MRLVVFGERMGGGGEGGGFGSGPGSPVTRIGALETEERSAGRRNSMAEVTTAGPAATSEAPVAAAAANPKKRKAADEVEAPTAPVANELTLPLQAIMRIVKAKMPEGMMMATETKKAFAKACSLFILYVSTMCVLPSHLRTPRGRTALANFC
jgi:hypothetical protein